MKKIVIVAGDKSGDLYGGMLAEKIKKQNPDWQVFSFGGEKLAANSKQEINLLNISVTGLAEVVLKLPKIFAAFDKTFNKINEIKPDLVILIDFPDFNLRLAKKLNKKFPLFYYVSPQVWAWRKERVEDIRKYIDKMIVLFAFEKAFYDKEKIESFYFGHPLLEVIQKTNPQRKNIISLMPGSRKNEIRHHLPVMIKSAQIIKTFLPEYSFRIIRPENIPHSFYSRFSANIPVITRSNAAIEESAFILASSGTATVEIALLEVPYLLMYKMNPLSWKICKNMIGVKFAGMVNILAGKKIVEEFLQDEATAENISAMALEYLNDPVKYEKIKQDLRNIREILYPAGATQRFADYINHYLNKT